MVQVKGSIIGAFHESRTTTRVIAGVALFFFSWMNVAPAVAAIKDEVKQRVAADPVTLQADATTALHALLNDRLGAIAKKAANAKAKNHNEDYGADRAAIKDLQEQLKLQDKKTLQSFEEDSAHIEKYKLSDVIKQRHDEAQAKFSKEAADVQAQLAAMQVVDNKTLPTLAQQLLAHLASLKPKPARTFDPKNLPFKVGNGKVRNPKTNTRELHDLLNPHLKLTSTALPVEHRKQEITAQELALIDKASREGGRYDGKLDAVQVASVGSLGGMLAVSTYMPPTTADVAATEDAQITPAIQALAAQLNNNPVQIYNWVRNTIKWTPTFGSIQGGQATLDKQSGNSFDTASLLISLLRAAGIPSRYVYGTIDVPVDKLQNWIGGTVDPNAALNILGQGGVPNLGLAQGGAIKAVRLETVWVEAFVDAYPSRGAKDSHPAVWVPMDPSFKQYTYTSGMDVANQVPFDGAGFLQQAKQGATIDNTNGFVQNLNSQNVSAAVTAYQTQVQSWVNSQNTNPTAGDLLGSKAIQVVNPSVLPTGLPYKVEAVGAAYSALPTNLRHQFTYSLYESQDAIANDSPMMSFQDFTSNLAEKKITLIFTPSTSNDLAALKSYLPQPHSDGTPIQPSELPKSIPAYNINVTPELLVEGQVIATGSSVPLGTSLLGQGGFTTPDLSNWDLTQEDHIAGRYSALGLSLGGIVPAQLDAVNARLASTKAALKAGDLSQITGENMSGDMLIAAIWGYHASVESFSRIAQKQAGIVENSGLSYGFIHRDISPVEKYGVITAVTFPGTLIDVSHLRWLSYAADNTVSKWIGYNLMRGHHASAMEHAAIERFTNDPSQNSSSQAVSAVKALAMASQLGQKIYNINSSNIAQIAQLQQSDATIADITNAVNNGKQVTIHQSPFSFEGQNWTGYTVIDPATGSGAYLIEGGSRGASEPSPAWDFLASTLGGIVDAILAVAKLLATDLAYLYEEPTLGLFKVGELTGALVGINLIVQIVRTLANDDLSTGGKIATILANLVVSILTIELSELVGAALFVGLADILVFTVLAAFIFSIFLYDLNLLLSFRQQLARRRLA